MHYSRVLHSRFVLQSLFLAFTLSKLVKGNDLQQQMEQDKVKHQRLAQATNHYAN